MNRQTYSVFLCALLASTFVHELRAKGVVPVNSLALEAVEPVALERVKRDASGISLGLSLEVVANLLVIYNSTSNAALVIDVSASVFLLLNGTSGSGVCIDRSNGTGSYFSEGLFIASNETLKDFLNSLEDGISELLDSAEAEIFTLINVKLSILRAITDIVVCLVAHIQPALEADLTLALEIVLSVVDGVLDLLSGVLEGLLDLVGELVIILYVDICGLLHLLQGLASVLEKVAGNLATCIEKGVIFKLELILGAVNGLVCLLQLILQLGEVLDLTALADVLGSIDSLFLLIAQLGGNVVYGINGIFIVIGQIVCLINGKVSLDVVIHCLLKYVVLSSVLVVEDLTDELINTLGDLLDALEKVGATEVLSDLVAIINDLIGGTLIFGGCDLSHIINRLLVGILGAVGTLLTLVVEILLLLVVVVGYVLSLPYLLLILICQLHSVCGIQLLKYLGIDTGIGSLLSIILNAVRNLVQLLLGNLYNVLVGLPIIGNIVEALNSALEEASGGDLSLKELLDLSSLVRNLIKGLFQLLTGIDLGLGPVIVVQISAILEAVASITAFIGIDIIAVVSVTVGQYQLKESF